ncbi:MAG: ATP-binding cassette domain-containing protein [Caldilineaceae bacterium]|nr:ATP-binding cassette domain-containing protein [Caldilineaceae bacterium]
MNAPFVTTTATRETDPSKAVQTYPLPLLDGPARMAASPSLIELRQVYKSFATTAGTFTALRNINLRVGKGEFIAVIGKSGSGKSTLLNMLAGIDRPTSGEIWMGGTAIHRLSEGELATWRGRHIGLVFQFFQLLPMLTVVENVMLPMDFCHLWTERQRQQRAMHLLEQVELADQANKLPLELSGGQQQRAAIARALANDPPILLADEPTGNLDSKSAESVFQLFVTLAQQGKTILMVTHDNDLAKRVGRTLVLSDGEVIDEYLTHLFPAVGEAQLLAAMHKLRPVRYAPGEIIVRQGEVADKFYIVTEGSVDIIIPQRTGVELVVASMAKGQYFGEIELLHGGENIATARASLETGVAVAALDRETFAQLMAASQSAEAEIHRVADERLAEHAAAEQKEVPAAIAKADV